MDAGEESEFRDFVTARSAGLLRTAYLLTGDPGHAEDAVQAALTGVYLAWPRIRHREAVDAYARRTLVREIGSWRRRRRVTQVLTATVPEPEPIDSGDQVGDRDLLHAALLALPTQQRAVVVLRFYDDLAEADIADVLGVSTGTVKQHTSRAMARLRRVLTETRAVSEESET